MVYQYWQVSMINDNTAERMEKIIKLCIWVMKLDVWFVIHYKANFSEAVVI